MGEVSLSEEGGGEGAAPGLSSSSRRGRRIVVVDRRAGVLQASDGAEVFPAPSPPGQLESGPGERRGSTVPRGDSIDDDVNVRERAVASNEDGLVLIQPKNRQTLRDGPAYLSSRCGAVPVKRVVQARILEGATAPNPGGGFPLGSSGRPGRHFLERAVEVGAPELARLDPCDGVQRRAFWRRKSPGNC